VSSYLLSNAAVQTSGRFEALARTYDEPSTRALAATGVGPGWRCWEVGGGGGSLAAWLADRVGSAGSVLVTDIDPQWMRGLDGRANIELCRHDVVRDPLPDGEFDLVHARLVLLHLPERHLVLDRLVSRLRPGGWLVVEDFDCERTPVAAAPSREDRELFESVHRTFLGLLRDRGADTAWGRSLPAALAEHGLREVSATTHAVTWRGGSPEIDLHRVNVEQLADRLLASGVDIGQLADFLALIDDPGFAVRSYPLVSAAGVRP
jgi:2-polyprenyl-3-methyl-5-hydroxy-6-metoxy-1,4-benzoquinol methylase